MFAKAKWNASLKFLEGKWQQGMSISRLSSLKNIKEGNIDVVLECLFLEMEMHELV